MKYFLAFLMVETSAFALASWVEIISHLFLGVPFNAQFILLIMTAFLPPAIGLAIIL